MGQILSRSCSERSQCQEHLPIARGVCKNQGTWQELAGHELTKAINQECLPISFWKEKLWMSLWCWDFSCENFFGAAPKLISLLLHCCVKSAPGCCWALFTLPFTLNLPWKSAWGQLKCKHGHWNGDELISSSGVLKCCTEFAWKSNQFKTQRNLTWGIVPAMGSPSSASPEGREKPVFQGPGGYFHHPLLFSVNSDIQVVFHLKQNF